MAIIAACCFFPFGAKAETVRDNFDSRSYDGNDGTQSWATSWLEIGENDGPGSGEIRVQNDQGVRWVLRIQNNRGIQREADLSGAIAAVLRFDYRRSDLDSIFDYVTVEVSGDGGASWSELDRFVGPQNDSAYQSASYDISSFIASNTRVRLHGSTYLGGSDEVYFDYIEIEYTLAPTTPLVAHYALEGNVTDSSGNGHDGGSQGAVAYQRAKICDGVQLDGGGYLLVPDNDDFDLTDALTVMAWIHPDTLSVPDHTEGLYSFLSKDTNFEFHVQSDGSLYWWWSNGTLTTAPGLVPVGAWSHVAFVYSRSAGALQIFVNGTQVASRTYWAALPVNNDPFYIGTDKTTGGGELARRRFYGSIDEVRIYRTALPPEEITALMNAADPCGAVIDHYEIVHDGSALTCAPETVTVRACADAACTERYSDDVTVDLAPSGWVGGDSQTLIGGSGVFRLRHTAPGTVTLTVSSLDPAADHAPQCVDGAGGSSCDLTFHEAGFLFDVADLTACSLEQNIRIAAVRADATGEHCIGDDSFANTTRNVNFWSSYQEPATGTRAVHVNGSAVSGAIPGTAVQLAFDAQAESLLDVSYADAGRVGLSARFAGSGEEAGLVMVGSDSFVAAPHHLQVQATTDGVTALDNATSTGDPHWPAGEDFTIAVSGACSDGSLTPNFASATNISAIAADPAPGLFSGGPLPAGVYSGGTATGNAAYSEVGTVTLQAEAIDYLGSGIDITGATVAGRFTPYRFDVSLNSPEFAPACAAGGFTYLGQAFTYATAPVITVTARNKNGTTTGNYTQGWWKITSTTLTGKTYSAAAGTLDLAGPPAGDPVVSDLGGGIGLLTFGDGGGIRFVRSSTPEAPFDAEISLAINVLDGDGIAAAANPVTFGAATAGSGIAFTGGGKQMRWGRLVLQNAYGSERVPLPMPFQSESFDGSSFVANTLDSCTGVALNLLSLSNASGTVTADNPIAVGTGISSASLSDPFANGDAGLQFSAPGAEGYIQVRVDLSSLPWLSYDWNGDGSQEGPAARATFGIYRGRPSLIYYRETYR